MKHLFTLNHYFLKYKWYLLLGILFVVLSNYFRVLIPRAVRESIDLVLEALHIHNFIRDTSDALPWESAIGKSVLFYGLLVLVAALVTGLFMYLMRQTIIVMSRLIEYDLRDEIFQKYTTFDQRFLRNHQTGDLMSRVAEDVNKVRMYLGPGLLYSINLISLFALVIYTMFQVNSRLAMFTLLPLPLLSISIYWVSRLINEKSFLIQQKLSALTAITQQVYSGIRVVKSYVQEKSLGDFFEEESEDFKRKSLDLARLNAFFFPLMILLVGMSTIITIYVGGLMAMAGDVTAGNIAEFVIYVNMLTWPVTAIGWIASIVQEAEASQRRINEFLEYESHIQSPEKGWKTAVKGDVRFEEVTFIYPDSGIRALDQISLHIQAGTSLAIVGRTASGKTTMAELIFRLFDPDQGQILVDGIDLRQWDLPFLRSQMAYVPQDVFLFSDTVLENIRFGDPTIDKETIQKYAKLSVVDQDILALRDGYDTMVGERGVSLSGGQKQRISLARALVLEPGLLILDDCLSAVDAMTESRIIDNMEQIMKGKTTIFITHRLQAMPLFDQIIVMDEGRIVNSGTHDELLARDGIYAELYAQQNLEGEEV